jgi:hypothetical protein
MSAQPGIVPALDYAYLKARPDFSDCQDPNEYVYMKKSQAEVKKQGARQLSFLSSYCTTAS